MNIEGLADWPQLLILVVVGGIAAGINSVAGGGSLISFPTLTLGFGIPPLPANATNSVALWPGSLSGAYGFINLLPATGHHLRALLVPTFVGAVAGSLLLVYTREEIFEAVVPVLLLVAATLLAFQPQIKRWALREREELHPTTGMILQLGVAVYGGYFGAGMGIMMLAAFALYMKGTIHEINAVKTWLGVVINLVSSVIFLGKGLIVLWPAIALTIGSIVGGFWAARASQKIDPERMRLAIAAYGFVTAGYFAYRTWLAP
ncbi:MAG TPA: sulfite exporter TauE/SafE family protein [Fimbriimonadaceae bacterium]|nr:sulfite exporter TauE/SafE family protein [Fimbriimonadaceae bacterium]